MNIMIINHYAGSPEMGMEFRPYYFAREWIKMGHRVDIIAADYSHLRGKNPKVKKDLQQENIEGINYHWIKTRKYKGNGAQRAITMFQFISKLWTNVDRINKEMAPDVVICSSTYPLDTFVGQRIKKKAKKPVKLIHEVHDMWPATLYEIGGMSKSHPFVQILQVAENSAYKKSDRVVSLLPYAEDYMKEHGMAEGKFVCIPNGVVPDEWENPDELPEEHKEMFTKLKDTGKYIVGYFGGHALSNALDSLLDVSAAMDDKDIHFVLVGDGVEKPNLIRRASEMGLENVTFLSPVRKTCVPNLCKEFDCVYMCGLDSPLYRFGLCLNKMFDTMASGKPGICALNVKSYFTEYKCGYDIKSDDLTDVCETIKKIKNMPPEKLKEMTDAGKKAATTVFNYVSLAEAFEKIILEG